MRSGHIFYRVDRRRINLVRFVFEAYEGLAVVTTLDAARGIIGLAVAPGYEALARRVMEDLAQQIRIEPIPTGEAGDYTY